MARPFRAVPLALGKRRPPASPVPAEIPATAAEIREPVALEIADPAAGPEETPASEAEEKPRRRRREERSSGEDPA